MAVEASTTLEEVVMVEAADLAEVDMISSKVVEVEAGGKLIASSPTACICAQYCQ